MTARASCEKATIKLDPTETPPTIELTVTQGKAKGTKLVGIYSRQDDKLTLCFRDPKWKDVRADRPQSRPRRALLHPRAAPSKK